MSSSHVILSKVVPCPLPSCFSVWRIACWMCGETSYHVGNWMLMMPKAWPLCTSAESNLGDRVLGEMEKNNFIALPGKGGQRGSRLKKLCVPTWEDLMKGFIAIVQGWGCWTRFGCVQGLHSFHLASRGLLWNEEC